MTDDPSIDASPDPSVAELRHDLRTPINHIVGYAEMLLEDSEGPEFSERRRALEDALGGAREAIDLINVTLPPTRQSIGPTDLSVLTQSFAKPQERIRQALQGLLAETGGSVDDTFLDDLKKSSPRPIAWA